MAFPDSFLEEIRNRVPLSGVVGRSVRLIKRGREFTGLCPFHNEKSPSFTVNDDKGFFHCFGCGAHGDVIGFVMRNGGLASTVKWSDRWWPSQRHAHAAFASGLP